MTKRAKDDTHVWDDIREGDWVRFYSGGKLVVAEVRYAKERGPYDKPVTVCTDLGTVSADYVIEVRRLAEWIESY